MNWYRIEGDWKHFVAAARAKWGKLSDEQLLAIAGRRDELAASIQDAYGISPEASQGQIDEWQHDQKSDQGDDEKGERVAGPLDHPTSSQGAP